MATKYIVIPDMRFAIDASRDSTGDEPPCLKLVNGVRWGPIRARLIAGVTWVRARCKYSPDNGESARPRLIVKANVAIGCHADVISIAPAGAGVWNEIPAIGLTNREVGGVEIYLDMPDQGVGAYAMFDDVRVTVG